MKKHLGWKEDDRVCNLPDPVEGNTCEGCCPSLMPKKYAGATWECIWKAGHEGNHCDIWTCEWDDNNVIVKRPKYNGRCYRCGDSVPYNGMMYCGKACSALG